MKLSENHPFRSAKAKVRFMTLYEERAKEWPVASKTRMVHTSFGQTFVRISGPEDAPPLVLLHGGNVSSLSWIPNVAALSEHFRTYAVDTIYDFGTGLGLSVYTRKLKKPSEFADWLDEFFDALALGDDINMMGMSYGGWITGQYALRCPNRLSKIVLLAPALTVFPGRFEMTARGMLSLLPPRRFFTKKLFYWLMPDAVQKSETSRLLVERIMDDMMTASKCLKRKMFVPPTVLSDEELKSIMVPALVLIGEHEKLYSAQDAVERLNTVVPKIKTEIIPNAGHDLPFVRAETVNRKVLEFLNQS